jgi:hypothetical protein
VIYATGLVHVNVTGPVKPTDGVAATVIEPVAPGAMDTAYILSERVSGEVMPSVRVSLLEPPKLPVAPYVAVMVSGPMVFGITVSVAIPLFSVPVPSEVVPLKNVTTPVGTPKFEVTVADRVSLAPTVAEEDARLRVVTVGIAVGVTVIARLVDGASLGSPAYCADKE